MFLLPPPKRNARRSDRRAFILALAVVSGLLLGLVAASPTAAADPSASPGPDGSEAPWAGAATWAIQPSGPDGPDGRSAFDYALAPGSETVDHVSVSNLGTTPLTLRIYATDAFTTDDGGFALLTADTPPSGVGAWIELPTDEITVPPATRVDIPFRLRVPPDAEPGDQAGGIVAALETAAEGSGQNVVVERRVGSRVYLQVAGEAAPAVRIDDVVATYDSGWDPVSGTLVVHYTVTNTGNVRLTARQAVTAAGPMGLWTRSAALDDLPEILPGGSVVTTTTMTGVPPLVSLDVDITLEPIVTRDGAAVTVAPVTAVTQAWALPILLAGIVLLAIEAIVAVILWRRRRTAAATARFEAAVAAARAEGEAAGRSEGGTAS